MKNESKFESLLAILSALLVFYLIFKFKVLIIIALSIGLIGLFIRPAGDAISWLWFKLAHILGWITSKVILTIIYYFLLFPIALISKLFRKDNLSLQKNKKSMWITRKHIFKPQDLENVW